MGPFFQIGGFNKFQMKRTLAIRGYVDLDEKNYKQYSMGPFFQIGGFNEFQMKRTLAIRGARNMQMDKGVPMVSKLLC